MEAISYIPNWAKEAVTYHIYPFGFFYAPKYGKDDPIIVTRLELIQEYYDHFVELGFYNLICENIYEQAKIELSEMKSFV
ncbi:hypothetical protein [Candidatus Lokiarchaeum ossiferum]|uniref:hypothetical protein n=1 Tax=Candidatus Lokiarchaeum ossiferum TaxID=2951803 RepID=UPI00352CDE6C